MGKIYLEAKARPRYIVESFIWKEGDTLDFSNSYSDKEGVDLQ